MPRKKPKSFLYHILKGLWWIISRIFKLIGLLVKSIFKQSSKAIKSAKVKSQQPKSPASYKKPKIESEIKGSYTSFESRFLDESLVVAIAGRRGSGKSALGFRFLENIKAKTKRPSFALGVKQTVLPSWINSIETLEQVSNNGIVLIDEGALAFGSRKSMSKENKQLTDILATARHKDLTLLFITQNTGMIDKTVLNLCDTIILKEGSLLQEKMERSAIKDLYKTANKAIKEIESNRKPFCYVFDADFEGLLSLQLPSFWSTKVSKNQA